MAKNPKFWQKTYLPNISAGSSIRNNFVSFLALEFPN